MAGGGRVQIHGANDLAQGAYVINHRLLVDTGGGGGAAGDVNIASVGGVLVTSPLPVLASQGTSPWVVSGTVAVSNFPATQPVSGTLTVLQGTSPWVVSGAVTVGGTVAVTQSTNPWTVDGTVAVGPTVTPGTGATNLGKAEDAIHASGDVGVQALAVRNDAGTLLADDGDYYPLTVEENGNLRVAVQNVLSALITGSVNVISVTPGVGASNLGKAEDQAHVSGDVGVMGLAVRQNTQVALAADGDYIPLTVNGSGSLYTTVNIIQPGSGATNLGKLEDEIHATGDLGVMALAVRNDAGTALAANGDYIPLTTDSAGRLHVLVGATVSIGSIVPGVGTTNLGKAEDGAHVNGATGVFALIVRSDAGVSTATTDGDYTAPIADASGNLWTTVRTIVPGTGALNLGKAEDAVHASGDVGVMSLGVRQDTPAALGANGDYTPPSFDNAGHLWVRNRGDIVTTIAFSASTRGRPVQIAATATPGTLIHTASTTLLDKIFLSLCNTSTSAVTVTIEYGAAGAALEIDIIVPANETVVALDGVVLGGAAGGDTVAAFASTGSVVNAVGRVERITA